MFAIISDIHANYEALQAVFDDIDRRDVTNVICLGDVIGYGASPRECLDLVIERTRFCLCGNHDQAVFFEPYNFNVGAERACFWTREQFETEPNKALRDRRWEFLGRLPIRLEIGDLLFVHGSPRRPVNEYLFAEDVYTNPQKILSNFERLQDGQRACFVGHTHVPGVFQDDPYFDPPDELMVPGVHELSGDEPAIINVGSVGQPRDRDNRGCYVLVHNYDSLWENPGSADEADSVLPPKPISGPLPKVEFVRVPYDVEKAAHKIKAIPDLDDFLGDRLMDGR
jgi:diadenosine tetraphosphatase ApaH/serine/threonine PP2A family protein phosphatase